MHDDFKILFQKYIDKSINKEELIQFYDYVEQADSDPQLKGLLNELWQYMEQTGKSASNTSAKKGNGSLFQQDRLLEMLLKENQHHRQEVASLIKDATTIDPRKDSKRDKINSFLKWFKKLFVMTLVIVAAGAWYYISNQEKATATVAYVEKVSEYGQKSTIPLPDGSVVKLNSGSKLTFPKLFEGDTREVTLVGEAFFEVARNEEKPFVIRSGELVTTVLGTSFNVRAYPEDKRIEVAVATGKVKVESIKDGNASSQLLTPNMVASYQEANSKISIKTYENINSLIAWREGVLQFSEVPFSQVAKTLEKWYGVPVVLENENVGNCLIFGEFKNESLDKVMKTLQHAIDIDYQLTTNGLTVSGEGCGTSMLDAKMLDVNGRGTSN